MNQFRIDGSSGTTYLIAEVTDAPFRIKCTACNIILAVYPSEGYFTTILRHNIDHAIIGYACDAYGTPRMILPITDSNSNTHPRYDPQGTPASAYTQAQTSNSSRLSSEIPVETGSYADFKQWDVNAVAEPIMRIWQLSEALSRMGRRIKKRYPEEAKQLTRASEDVVYAFAKDMAEKQKEHLKNTKSSEESSVKDLDAAHQRQVDAKKAEIKKNDTLPTSGEKLATAYPVNPPYGF